MPDTASGFVSASGPSGLVSVKVEPLIVVASIALEKVASTLDPIGTSDPPLPGVMRVTVGGVVPVLPGTP